MGQLKVKVCGITEYRNMLDVVGTAPDYLGFIFFPGSPRYVGRHPEERLFRDVPGSVEKVAVLVNETVENIIELCRNYGIGTVQLHGMESPEACGVLQRHGLVVIKALSANFLGKKGVRDEYAEVTDYFLFDTPTEKHGGSGRKFDWDRLDVPGLDKSFFLSGGISPSDCMRISQIGNPGLIAVDINSKFEISPGIKDSGMVSEFIKCIRDEK